MVLFVGVVSEQVNYAAGSGEDIDGCVSLAVPAAIVADTCGAHRYPLAGFIRVEFFTPDALLFQAPDGAKHDVVLRSTPEPAPRAVAEAEVDAASEPTFDDDDSELGTAYVATFARAGPLGLELATTPAGRVVVKGVVPNAAAAKVCLRALSLAVCSGCCTRVSRRLISLACSGWRGEGRRAGIDQRPDDCARRDHQPSH